MPCKSFLVWFEKVHYSNNIMLGPSILFLTLGIFISTGIADTDRCYARKDDFYPYLSTKSSYKNVHGIIFRPPPTCKPIQMWSVMRHGTRYPNKGVIAQLLNLTKLRDEIIGNHEKKGTGHLCPTDLDNLRKWKINPELNVAVADELTIQGKEEFHWMAKHLQTIFPELLTADSKTIKSTDYVFRATDTQRTKLSLEAFTNGLFNNSKIVTPTAPIKNDNMLRPDKNCPYWDTELKDNAKDIYAQRDNFTAGTEFQNLLDRISKRLGFTKKLDLDTVKTMYDMCRYESAWQRNDTSIWCKLFRKEDLQIMEYLEDLTYYYASGPGRNSSSILGCEMVKDMFSHFKKLESGDSTDQPKGIFYFAHTATLQVLRAALKIGADSTPITATNYPFKNRNYRTSLLGSFATNFAAVFYRCNDDSLSPNKVAFYVAERMIQMPGCDAGFCNFDDLIQEFSPLYEHCNFAKYCRLQNNNDPDGTSKPDVISPTDGIDKPNTNSTNNEGNKNNGTNANTNNNDGKKDNKNAGNQDAYIGIWIIMGSLMLLNRLA